MWTRFMDMSSGGSRKEDFAYLYIEAPEAEAKAIFYSRFGHNPERVTCTCCGDDYSISEGESLAQLTGYDRGCRALETPRDPETGLYMNDDPVVRRKYYYEPGEQPPEGYKFSEPLFPREHQTIDEYLARDDVAVIRAEEIKDEERTASIPEQGYVWVD